mgnify:CR=1 FL=1
MVVDPSSTLADRLAADVTKLRADAMAARATQRAVEAVALLSELLRAAMPGIEWGLACTGEAMERADLADAWETSEDEDDEEQEASLRRDGGGRKTPAR